MNVFVFEYLTAGGLLGSPLCDSSLLCEGTAMVVALASDLAAIVGVQVQLLWDQRIDRPPPLQNPSIHCLSVGESQAMEKGFRDRCARCDATVLIAPELDGVLLRYARLSEELGANLIGPSADWIQLASDKSATCNHWNDRNVPTPSGGPWSGNAGDLADWPFPLIQKRNDGAGSEGLRRIRSMGDLPPSPTEVPLRLERYCPGLPVSMAVIGGPDGPVFLPACGQRLSGDGYFRYLGGWLLGDSPLQCRAERLARRAIEALPPVRGYIGLDMILGPDPAGSQDVAIEANPRLTTSYIGLRQATSSNLAQLWWDVVRGGCVARPEFQAAGVHFFPHRLA